MNLLILTPDQFISKSSAQLLQRQHEHVQNVLKLKEKDYLSVGLLNDRMGTAKIVESTPSHTIIEVEELNSSPPATIPLTLILGLPRPRMLQRTLQTIATMGVEKLILLQTSRVEKSFWQTPLLKEECIQEQLIIGLEQAKATQLPEVHTFQRFRPFIEDELPNWLEGTAERLIAHPGAFPPAQRLEKSPAILAIGPEGGFLPKEVDQFVHYGFQPIQLGERILRVETAVPVLLGKLF